MNPVGQAKLLMQAWETCRDSGSAWPVDLADLQFQGLVDTRST